MLKNYFTVALRVLQKHKGYAAINVIGLAVGMAGCLLIALYVIQELGYDRFYDDADRIYRIAWINENPQTRTPHPMAQAMVRDMPEVEHAVSLTPIWGPGLTRPTFQVRYEEVRHEEQSILAVDSTLLDVLSYTVLQGDARTALSEPFQIVLTASMAEKYFGPENPIGKSLRINEEVDLSVGAVFADVPEQAHFHFDFLISYVTLREVMGPTAFFEWEDFGHYNYIKLAEGVRPETVEKKISTWIPRYVEVSDEARISLEEGRIGFRLQPITEIHLESHLRWELEPTGDMRTIYSLMAAALFLLLIASINFMNLSTARSMDRAREVGMRKALGASRAQLIRQFIGESILLSLLSYAAAMALIEVVLPAFNRVAGIQLEINYIEDLNLMLGMLGMVLLVGFLSGSYPAFYLSRYQPMEVFRGSVHKGKKGFSLRQGLVVFQFALSIALIVGTIVISNQVVYMRSMELGFEPEQVVVLPLKDENMREQYRAIKAELLKSPVIEHAGAVSNIPGGRFNQNPVWWMENEDGVDMSEWRIGEDLLQTLDMEVVEGRGFSLDHTSDLGEAFLINETAARQFDWETAVGEELVLGDDIVTQRGRVIGVVKDFHFASLHSQVGPIIMQLQPGSFNYMLVKVDAEDVPAALAHLQQVWSGFSPGRSFDYSFLDSDFAALYEEDERMGSMIAIFSILAIFIACLGLFGLAAFTAEQRTKEIGVRKVMGASVGQIVLHLTGDFARLILFAFIVAAPIAYFIMEGWLAAFPYHISVGPWNLILAGMLAATVAGLSVSYQSVRAAQTNPVDALRSE